MEFLKNKVTGVIFVSTPELLKNRNMEPYKVQVPDPEPSNPEGQSVSVAKPVKRGRFGRAIQEA